MVSWRSRPARRATRVLRLAAPGRPHQAARALERTRHQLARQQPLAGVGAGQGEGAGPLRGEAEAAVIGCIAHQQDSLMTARLRLRERMAHQLAADAALAEFGLDRQRPEQQRRPPRAGRDVPQPHGADQAAVRAGDERQALRRQPALAQPLGRLGEAAIPEG